ncbi:MAG TPA: hypothetical protein VFJ58_27400 [Armatimonadota bacterium]|nr:hypothetical protein [Armatimonadota bacterium]
MRFFNTSGPVNREDHYCLPPLERWDLEEILSLIDQKRYFVLHAPRQTGKTTCLLSLVQYLNHQGKFRALYANLEAAQAAREDLSMSMSTVVHTLGSEAAFYLGDTGAIELARDVRATTPAGSGLVTTSVRGLSLRASSCAACGTCATTASTPRPIRA